MDLEPHIRHVYGPEEVTYGLDELVVVCLVRDGRPYLKSFVEHYSSLGVKHIVFLDNGSSDGTVSAARSYDNVTILQTELPFKENEVPLKQYLMTRFGKDRWVLYVDIDELFDYPYSDVVSLSSFLGYLTEKSYTAVVGQMLDMFPEEPLSHTTAREDEPLKELYRFYDISDIIMDSYGSWPRRRHGRYPDHDSNTVASEEIKFHRGGIQRTIFGESDLLLTKHPLIFIDEETRPVKVHRVGGARVADITCVLFHYKFIGDFYKRVVQAVEEKTHGSDTSRYKRYLEALKQNPELRIKLETAQELKGVNDLVDNQFLVVSGDYMAWIDTEERKNGAADTLRGSESHRLVEAFSKVSTKARTQAAEVRNLERRVALLEKSLTKERRKNRSLERRIEDIRGSRSWRLLGKLGHIQAKIRGKGQQRIAP